jgi:hypothetical protein
MRCIACAFFVCSDWFSMGDSVMVRMGCAEAFGEKNNECW